MEKLIMMFSPKHAKVMQKKKAMGMADLSLQECDTCSETLVVEPFLLELE